MVARKDDYNNAWPHNALGISHHRNTPIAASPDRNGAGCCATSRLRAPGRCSTEPLGAQIPPELSHRWMKHRAQTIRLHRSDGTTLDNKGEAVNALAGPMTTSHTTE